MKLCVVEVALPFGPHCFNFFGLLNPLNVTLNIRRIKIREHVRGYFTQVPE